MSKKENSKDIMANLREGETKVRKTCVGNKTRKFYIYKQNLFSDCELSESLENVHLSNILKSYMVATIVPEVTPNCAGINAETNAETPGQHDNEPEEVECSMMPSVVDYIVMLKLKKRRAQFEVSLLSEQQALAKREKYKVELELLKLELELGLTQRSTFTEHITIADDVNQ